MNEGLICLKHTNFVLCGSSFMMQVFVGKISALLNPVTYVIINVAIVAVIWVGGEQVDSGTITRAR